PEARRDPQTGRHPRARPATAMAPPTMTTAPARDGAAGGVRAAPAAGPPTRTPRPRAPTQRRSRRTANQARTPPPALPQDRQERRRRGRDGRPDGHIGGRGSG